VPHLLIDARSLTTQPKGVGRYAYQLCTLLDHLLPMQWHFQLIVNQEDLPSFSSSFRGKWIVVPPASEMRMGFKILPKLIKQIKPDILLRPSESVGSNYGIPILTICHDINEWIAAAQESQGQRRKFFRKTIDRIKSYCIGSALRKSEYVLCNSEFIRQSIAQYYRVQYDKTAIAYCGVDQRFYLHSKKIDKEWIKKKYQVSSYILTFATGDYRENFLSLPKVISTLKKNKCNKTFIIAGVKKDSAYSSQLKNNLNELNLIEGEDYIIEGFMAEDRFMDLVSLYTAADFYLELSLHEGFGMQAIEAMACGTHCISSSKGALSEVTGGYATLIDDPNNIDEIVFKILSHYKNIKSNRDDQIEYTKKFSWHSTSKTVAKHLLKIADKYQIK
jgi:glycosyltransferase involved in cell wall biosynthesis